MWEIARRVQETAPKKKWDTMCGVAPLKKKPQLHLDASLRNSPLSLSPFAIESPPPSPPFPSLPVLLLLSRPHTRHKYKGSSVKKMGKGMLAVAATEVGASINSYVHWWGSILKRCPWQKERERADNFVSFFFGVSSLLLL